MLKTVEITFPSFTMALFFHQVDVASVSAAPGNMAPTVSIRVTVRTVPRVTGCRAAAAVPVAGTDPNVTSVSTSSIYV